MNRKPKVIKFVLSLMVLSAHASMRMEYQTTVVDVIDGKKIVISNKVSNAGIEIQSKETIELDGIDSPELDQPGGKEAHQYLKDIVKGARVKVIEVTDGGHSKGGWFFPEGQTNSVNLMMIEDGMAWWKQQNIWSVVSPDRMKKAQDRAKEGKRGLWGLDNPVPPWQWRKERKDCKKQ